MEGWIGLIKKLCRKHNLVAPGWLKRLAQRLDLYILGSLYFNMIDFTSIERNHGKEQILLWEGEKSEREMYSLECELSAHARNILNLIESVKLGQHVPRVLQIYMNRYNDDEEYFQRLGGVLDAQDCYEILAPEEALDLMGRLDENALQSSDSDTVVVSSRADLWSQRMSD